MQTVHLDTVAIAQGEKTTTTADRNLAQAEAQGSTQVRVLASTGSKQGGSAYASGEGARAWVIAHSNTEKSSESEQTTESEARATPWKHEPPPCLVEGSSTKFQRSYKHIKGFILAMIIVSIQVAAYLHIHEYISGSSEIIQQKKHYVDGNIRESFTKYEFELQPSNYHVNDTSVYNVSMIESPPVNTLVNETCYVRFNCSRQNGSDHTLQWWVSFQNSPSHLISDGETLVDHANWKRYELERNDTDSFNLIIHDVQKSDAGTYICFDKSAGGCPAHRNHGDGETGRGAGAELIVMEGLPVCRSSISDSGIVIEKDIHVVECLFSTHGNLEVYYDWSHTDLSPTRITNKDWSGVQLTIDESNDNTAVCVEITFEKDVFCADYSSRPWSYKYCSPKMTVNWPLRNLRIAPSNNHYYLGDTIRCSAHAKPPATIKWKNEITDEWIDSDSFTITKDLVGTKLSLRCIAENTVEELKYNASLLINVDVIDCPKQFTNVPWLNNSCYHFVRRKAERTKAEIHCSELAEHAHLASIDDDTEKNILLQHLFTQDMSECQDVLVRKQSPRNSICGPGFHLIHSSDNVFIWEECIQDEIKSCFICEVDVNKPSMLGRYRWGENIVQCLANIYQFFFMSKANS